MKGSRGPIACAFVGLTAIPLAAAQSPAEWSAGPFGFNEVLRFGTRELDPSDSFSGRTSWAERRVSSIDGNTSAVEDVDGDGDADLYVDCQLLRNAAR